MIKLTVTGQEKLINWVPKLPEDYSRALERMRELFIQNYKKRLNTGVDINGNQFKANELVVEGRKITSFKDTGALIRTGTMRDSLYGDISPNNVRITFLREPYTDSDENVADVAAKHQKGYSTDGAIITGYPKQPKKKMSVLRSFRVPKREHFGIPELDIAHYREILRRELLAELKR